jgi:hypothetical protein
LSFWLGKIAFRKKDKKLVESFLADTNTHSLEISKDIYHNVLEKRPELLIDYREFKKSGLYPLHESEERPTSAVITYPNPDVPKTKISSTITENGILTISFINAYSRGTFPEWLKTYGLSSLVINDQIIRNHYDYFVNLLEVYSTSSSAENSTLIIGLQKSGYFLNNNVSSYTSKLRYCPVITPKLNGVAIDEWESHDIFALMFIEVVECVKNRLIPKKCSQCGEFMFIRRSDKNVCPNCPPPSQTRSATTLRVFENRLFKKCCTGKRVNWVRYQGDLMAHLKAIGHDEPETYISDKEKYHRSKDPWLT